MKANGPQFIRFMQPLLEVLFSMGGSGSASEVTDRIIERCEIADDELEVTLKSGSSKVRNEIAWCRQYLVFAGLIDNSQRGLWRLTSRVSNEKIEQFDALETFRYVQSKKKEDQSAAKPDDDEIEDEVAIADDFRIELLKVIRNLSPGGFERLCQRLLRESGFERVEVTGKSGDGGIDGKGILQINDFVSVSVMFQCKRYGGSVGAEKIRDFRGAITGRTDWGIILTTGTFTTGAKQEAQRDGARAIELVAGDDLIELFVKHELGLKPRTTYDLDSEFFSQFDQDNN